MTRHRWPDHDLALVAIVTLILALTVTLAPGLARAQLVFGIIFTLFISGYALTSALFPRKSDLEPAGRLAISIVLSLVQLFLSGFILNFTWGIENTTLLLFLSLLIFLETTVAQVRRYRGSTQERVQIPVTRIYKTSLGRWKSTSGLDRVLLGLLVLVLVSIGATAYLATGSRSTNETFTEFFLLDAEFRAKEYPKELQVGETAQVVIGIANWEYRPVRYQVAIESAGLIINRLGPYTLEHGERLHELTSFSLDSADPTQRVNFSLFKDEAPEPYRSLVLWVEVRE